MTHGSHSLIVINAMNFMNNTHVISLFPQSTFVYNRVHLTKPRATCTNPLTLKWCICKTEDFHGLNDCAPVEPLGELQPRYVGDVHCWSTLCFPFPPAQYPPAHKNYSRGSYLPERPQFYHPSANVITRGTMHSHDMTTGKLAYIQLPTTDHFFTGDLCNTRLFPNGAFSALIPVMPGLQWKLHYSWRIFISNHLALSPPNLTIKEILARDWQGNVIIAKLNKSTNAKLKEIHPEETDLAVALVLEWIDNLIY
ncbi:hypothetical protein CPB83DRAFT_900109 [Crepidotus variabilis]|uniref:Uncharacterized protein n=1 Tax=Crepidotus variabilis TaxID=179855 RepID=A0A9P6JI76_9AGAR|nr:hypothetical protein CPB83DRAFT_900109 [Crepidotus variabilis]